MDRYHRQILLPQIGASGQARIGASTVLLVGVGALGSTIADQLARTGVGKLVLVDRDIIEITNLQRQTLYSEADVSQPKATAAARRLAAVNSAIHVEPVIADITPGSIYKLMEHFKPDVIVDGTDNAQTRYLINDLSIEQTIPWVYGACVGTEGRVMPIYPNRSACLRCIFPTPPAPGEIPTCDTAGVLGAGAAVVGAIQASEVIRILVAPDGSAELITLDLWTRRFRTIDVTNARRTDCPACAHRRFDYLHSRADVAVSLCGRNTVQIRLAEPESWNTATQPFLDRCQQRLESARGPLLRSPYLIRTTVEQGVDLTLFADGRVLVHGTADLAKARSIVARYLG